MRCKDCEYFISQRQEDATVQMICKLDGLKRWLVDGCSNGQAIQSDFNNIYPWSDMRRCNLSDNGTVNAYHGDPLYAEDGSNGQVMVEIPKAWWMMGARYRVEEYEDKQIFTFDDMERLVRK